MKLREFIEKLQALPPEALDLPVCLAEWREGYGDPDETEAEKIKVAESIRYTKDNPNYNEDGISQLDKRGNIILIGGEE